MASNPAEELAESLMQFRQDLLLVLADMETEITALRLAVQEKAPISEDRLKDLERETRKSRERFQNRFAEKIEMPHIRR